MEIDLKDFDPLIKLRDIITVDAEALFIKLFTDYRDGDDESFNAIIKEILSKGMFLESLKQIDSGEVQQ